jgi:hypothetical protein
VTLVLRLARTFVPWSHVMLQVHTLSPLPGEVLQHKKRKTKRMVSLQDLDLADLL